MKIKQKLILTLPDGSEIELSKDDAESLRDSLIEILGHKKSNNIRRRFEELERYKEQAEKNRKNQPLAYPHVPPINPPPLNPWETGPRDPLPGEYPIIWCSSDNKISLTAK